jgi:regulatory protein
MPPDSPPPAARTTSRAPRKVPTRISPAYLENAALHYLQRFATSQANLRRVLLRKVERSCRHHGQDPAEFTGLVDDLVQRYVRSGMIDDQRYAEAQVASSRRRGRSAQGIRARLAAKGVGGELVQAALAEHEGDDGDAARAFARRRRLGPWRTTGNRADFRERDLASLGRAGFAYDIARTVIDSEQEAS